MTVYLLRHAKAGSRSDFDGADWLRPLTPPGQLQARGLLQQYHDAKFARVFSSPYVRCMETVVPLAAHHGLAIEPHDALAEGADLAATLQLIDEHLHAGAILCSHGDVIPMVLDHLRRRGVDLGSDPLCEKGSTWKLEGDLSDTTTAQYWSPPQR